MANSKIIIVEGAQGAGKTTITDYIRPAIPYTNLYRLSGTADSTPTGRAKSEKMYIDLVDYIEKLQNMSINLLFDRTFFTEEIYCFIGEKIKNQRLKVKNDISWNDICDVIYNDQFEPISEFA